MKLVVAAALAIILGTAPALAAETLKVGTDPDYKPISFADASGTLVGVDPDFAAALAKHLGMSVAVEGVAWDGIVPALQGGKIDAITNLVVTDKRKEVVAFSTPYLTQTITTVVRADKPDLAPKPADLAAMKVGVMVNTSAADVVAKIPGVSATSYNTVADEYADLLLGRIDVVAIESLNGAYTVKAVYPGKLRITNVPLSPDRKEIAVALRKSDTNLMVRVDKAIAAMRSDGSLAAIASKWFGDDASLAKP